ncbi:methylation-associated defense system AAA family ATPase MAD3 [Gaoshiqia sp. Z1-71]|uniref:methylation-associated defense system AAA family ATPase MAD3 n=1 Tax=Gaoshiqia hydrogeniformans TaxID=3290090 RepID=UPI003BF78221
MITKVEAANYRCLKRVSQCLSPFQILVGPNASGKTTFLDVITFISDIVNNGLDEAITVRSQNFNDLTWSGNGGDIELAIECCIPSRVGSQMGENKEKRYLRYELKIGLSDANEHSIKGERLLIFEAIETNNHQVRTLFPELNFSGENILNKKFTSGVSKLIIKKNPSGNDNFYPEPYSKSSGGWLPSFKLGYKKSSLANLPADESKFPASAWLKEYLNTNIQKLVLNSQRIREASRPGQGKNFLPDGSNLPWVIEDLKIKYPSSFEDWLKHVRTALPDIEEINVHEFPDTKFKYLKIKHYNGIEVPSWTASDGTLRLLALTLIAYLPEFNGIFLIEEPENGVHPKVMETVFQSLSSVYDAQILLATHSPVILGIADIKDILCFAKTKEGITDIVSGDQHPQLSDWQKDTSLSILFASGVLG